MPPVDTRTKAAVYFSICTVYIVSPRRYTAVVSLAANISGQDLGVQIHVLPHQWPVCVQGCAGVFITFLAHSLTHGSLKCGKRRSTGVISTQRCCTDSSITVIMSLAKPARHKQNPLCAVQLLKEFKNTFTNQLAWKIVL